MVRNSLKYLISLLFLNSILSIALNAQSPMSNSEGNFRETVWLQTDRHLYLSGEKIDFHAMVLERDTYKTSALSKNIRIELDDSDGASLARLNMVLNDAGIEGSVSLSGDLKSGWYYLRAYTNWMRNFPDSDFAVVPVKVINPGEIATFHESSPVLRPSVLPAQKIGLVITTSNHNLIINPVKPGSGSGENLRLLVHRSGTWYWFENKKLTESISFTVPKDQIPEGIVQFSLLADDGTVMARRLWYNSSSISNPVSISLVPDNIKIRSQVKAEYEASGFIGKDDAPCLSVMISMEEPENPDNDYLPGMPGWTCNSVIPEGKEAFEKWLEDNCYSDEIIQAFFQFGQEINKGLLYLPETRTNLLSGRVIDRKTSKPVAEAGIGVSLLAANRFDAMKTNKDGLFYFTFPDIKSASDYILSFIAEPDSTWSIEVFSEFDKRPFKPRKLPFNLSHEELEFARELSTNLQLNRIYSKEEVPEPVGKEPAIREKPFYDPPDKTIYTDNYIELANVGEVVYEVVPNVQVHRDGNRARIGVYSIQPFAHDYETLVLLDGIPLTSQKELLDLPPGRIKSIDVRNKIYIHGNYVFSAVVNFISRNGDFAGLKLPGHSVQGALSLPSKIRLKASSATGHESTVPQLDPLLLWQTGLKFDTGNIDFSINDLYGNFKIRLYGFDSSGKWWMGKTEFRIGAKK